MDKSSNLKTLRTLFKNRPDTEHEQALIRIGLSIVISIYFAFAILSDSVIDSSEYSIIVGFPTFIFFSIVILFLVLSSSNISYLRRLTAIVMDSVGTTVCLIYGGEMAAPVFACYLWVAVGNGCRYGTKYLTISATISLIGFVILPFLNPYFLSVPTFYAGMLITLIAVPPYLYILIKRFEKANTQLEYNATHDSLTGALNRRSMEDNLNFEFARSLRYKFDMSIIMLDIDLFKKVNDVFGHHAGDDVLRNVSKEIKSILRDTDVLARFGGEEFIAILPNTNLTGATNTAKRIKDGIESLTTYFDDSEINVTISSGIVSNPDEFDNIEQMLRLADAALFTSKKLGRNRYTVKLADIQPEIDLSKQYET